MSVFDHLDRHVFKPGDLLFEEGELTTHFYIIETGQVEVYIRNSQGQKIQLSIVGEGEPLGEFALISKKPRSASAAALSLVSAYKVSEKGYEQLMEELPYWAQMMIKNLIKRLSESTDTIKLKSK